MKPGEFVRCFRSEWLKKKRSLGSWLVVAGAFFTPSIVILARLIHHDKLPALYSKADFWTGLWKSSWESMAIFFLPMSAILVTSLVTQIEYRNNAWKQVHTLPVSLAAVFLAKLLVILLLMARLLLLFILGVYLSAAVPCLLFRQIPYPSAALPVWPFLTDTCCYLAACLPIVTAQYLLSLRFKNFLAPIGIGFMLWVAALAALSWKYAYAVPYAYTVLSFLKDDPKVHFPVAPHQLLMLAGVYSLAFLIVGYALFVTKQQKG